MSEEIKIIDGTYKKDDPHKDIGKQKFRVRKAYTAWVEYDVVAETKDEAIDAVIEHGGIDKIEWADGYHNDEPVEVYAQDYNPDSTESFEAVKVAECVPYEDWDSDTDQHFENYEDPEWTTDSSRWKNEDDKSSSNINDNVKEKDEIPF